LRDTLTITAVICGFEEVDICINSFSLLLVCCFSTLLK
jgi:hypothetical protein